MTTITDTKKVSALEAGTVKIGNFIVNRMGLGAMRLTGEGIWGPPADPAAARRLLRRAVDLDVNFIDTADAYGPKVSEKLIRDALDPYEGLIIATKGGLKRTGPGVWYPDGSPEHLQEACLASLKRLGVDKITLYQLHRPDPAVPLRKSLEALAELQRAGKIRYIGLSNVTLRQLQEALEITSIVSVQNPYNLQFRRRSEGVVNLCEEQGIAFVPYFPMGGGGGDLGRNMLRRVARRHGATPHQIALAWLLARSPVILPIPGTSSIQHLEANVAAGSIRLSEKDMADLNTLSD